MQNNESKKTTTKTIRIDNDLVQQIENLAQNGERSFSQQVKFMLKEYIRIKDGR